MGDEIDKTRAISSFLPQASRQEERREQKPRRQRPTPRNLNDVESVLGIPARKITPEVNQAIISLLDEVDHLREEAEVHQGRIAFLEQQTHQHSFLPLLNRRTFETEVGRILARDERTHMGASLVIFDLKGATKLKDSHGLAAAEAALLHGANIIVNSVRQSDAVGFLGWTYIGVILTQAVGEAASVKAARIAHDIQTNPCKWQERVFFIEVNYVWEEFLPVPSAGELIYRVEQKFRR